MMHERLSQFVISNQQENIIGMGVRGLQGFLCGDPKGRFSGLPNGVNKIDMREKIQRWKR